MSNLPLDKGLKVYKLSDEELEKYRQMPPPTKYKDYSTLAVRHESKNSIISTSRNEPNGRNWGRYDK